MRSCRERIPRDECDAFALAVRHDVVVAAISRVVAILDKDDLRDLLAALQILECEIGYTNVSNLSFLLQFHEFTERIFERYARIDRMQLVKIDALDPQSLQASFACFS